MLELFFFLGLEDEDFLAEVDVVALSTMMTSRLLDGMFPDLVSSVPCLRFDNTLEAFGVMGFGCSNDSVGGPQVKVTVGVFGFRFSFGAYTLSEPEVLLLVRRAWQLSG